ncbi:TetR/AcrR family transcriptional regulator [Ornithinimicrobium sp. F0845]|uniref:TetR/AcrR family transcriptional regulator n=1 Tax=Ornithinimicrobium sp. F0845 TaxID=2926412 RepID=UPI001FF5D03B|nr:TetR/AcrR family transcriptional regulator [Ornithinimicrobium sp. F0845]MCK0114329.1 TetR/AcrR family transcriptional regulator [Ornithinimicrobium sp. F0845]
MPPRAPALPPDERRATIVAAALGILRTKGEAATTREIAEAAGVAEGTLFRVFRTKEDLVCTAMAHAFDPAPMLAGLRQVDAGLPLRERLVTAVEVIQARYRELFDLMHSMRLVHPPEHRPGASHDAHGAAWRRQVEDELIALVEPDADQLRVPVAELVDLVGLLSFAGSHPVLTQGRILSADTIIEVLLDGTRKGDPC